MLNIWIGDNLREMGKAGGRMGNAFRQFGGREGGLRGAARQEA